MGACDYFTIGYEYINSPLIHEKCYLATSAFLMAKSYQKNEIQISKFKNQVILDFSIH
jgi:hypothetical protein